MARAPAALLAAALLAGCMPRLAGTAERRSEELSVGAARFRIVYPPGEGEGARRVRGALAMAASRVERWGGLRRPVTVTIHPSHEALEAAVDRRGYPWLHAWARFDTIDLQSPRTWGPFGASERKLDELVAHELTHCATYQLSGDEASWRFQGIPRWFLEGMASVTADQGYRYGGIESLHRFYRERFVGPDDPAPARGRGAPGDPILDPDPLYQAHWRVAYGAAHHAFEHLLARHGEDRVIEVLRLMSDGLRFPAAFREAIGMSDAEFASEFRRQVVSQAWRVR